MSAPTPISALLHSSTMVIAGVYIGLSISEIVIIIGDYYSVCSVIYFMIPLITILWSLLKSLLLNDIKSIIALSTVSQISYMFIVMNINSMLVIYHLVIHSLFKSILFIIAGTLIHISLNNQSIYWIRINSKYYMIIYILSSNVLILSLSKELIVSELYLVVSSLYIWLVLVIGAVFSTLYSIKIYMYCFWIINYLLIILSNSE